MKDHSMASSENVTLFVRTLTAAELEVSAEDLDLRFEDQLGNLDPVTGFLIVGGAIAAGTLVIRIWREFRGGTVIDLTKSPPDISRDRDLDYGFFVIVASDGSVTVDAKDEPETALERMVTAVLKLGADAAVEMVKGSIDSALAGTN